MTDQWLVRKLLEQDKKIEALSRGGTGVGHTSIAPGEALTVISEDGEVVLGAGGVDYVDGPTPATPSAPTLKLGFGTIEVTWDGSFAAGEDENGIPLVAPIDFDVAEVHCSTDPLEEEWGDDTRRGQIKTREGGTIAVGGFDVDDEVFVCLIALAKTGKRSAPSATASLVIEGLDFSQLFNELDAANATIKNAGEILVTEQGTLGEKLAESDAALDALEVSLGELDETTLPALRNDLDAAEGRLDSAEGQITDAFGQLDAVPGQISDARQEAIDAALAEIANVEGDLVSSIDKKVNWSLSDPPAVFDGPADATWFKLSSFGSGGQVVSQWRWNGNVWVSTIMSESVLAKISIGTGTFGSMSGSRLDVGSVLADRVLVGAGRNIIPWSQVLSGATVAPHVNRNSSSTGTLVIGEPDPAAGAPRHMMHTRTAPGAGVDALIIEMRSGTPVSGNPASTRFAISGGSWTFSCNAYTPVANLDATLSLIWHKADQSYGGEIRGSTVRLSAVPQRVLSTMVVPDSAAYVIPYVRTNQPGETHWVGMELAQAVGATLIQDGAITTDKVAANVLEVGNLKAGTAAIAEAVVQKIAAQTASIQTADIKNLFVTGTSSLSNVVAERIAAETAEFIELEVGNLVAGTGTMDTATINKLFADVVVAGMSIATEFIGENAILTGAVTAPKITASEELWAKIGEFVKIRAEQLEADAIDGMVITGATIQSAATGARVQLSASGIESYNDANERTFYAEASSGNVYMVGSFYSNNQGQPRVEIDNDDWASIPVVDDTGATQYVNGAGVRIGSSVTDGFSIYHGAWSREGGSIRGQSAVIEGPLGRGRFSLGDNGQTQMTTLDSSGYMSGAVFTDASGGVGLQAIKTGVVTNQVLVKNYAFRAQSYGATRSGSARSEITAYGQDYAEMKVIDSGGSPRASVRTNSDGNIELTGTGDLYMANARWRLAKLNTTTGSANLRFSGSSSSSGFIGLLSSSRRFKVAEEPLSETVPDFVERLMSVEAKTWFDKNSAERLAASLEPDFGGEDDLADVERLRRIPGVVAEDLHDAGLHVLVEYDENGDPSGVMYDRIGVALFPVVREQREQLRELRYRIEKLERQTHV